MFDHFQLSTTHHFITVNVRLWRLECIMSITSDAMESDSVSCTMIRPILHKILPVITPIYDHSIITGIFPPSCKEASITPLPKPSQRPFPNIDLYLFRHSYLKFLSTLPTSSYPLFFTRISSPINRNLGSVLRHSTTTTLVSITDDIRSSIFKYYVF